MGTYLEFCIRFWEATRELDLYSMDGSQLDRLIVDALSKTNGGGELIKTSTSELSVLIRAINSLPEETAPKGYDEAYLNECIAKASKTWEGVDVDKYMDEMRGNRPKLSDNSLDEEIAGMYQALFGTDVINRKERLYLDTFEAIARHFAKWGAEHVKEDKR